MTVVGEKATFTLELENGEIYTMPVITVEMSHHTSIVGGFETTIKCVGTGMIERSICEDKATKLETAIAIIEQEESEECYFVFV